MNADGALLTVPQLLACGAMLIAVMGCSSWLLLREDRAARQLLTRIDTVSGTYARVSALQSSSRQKTERTGASRVWSAMAALFGYNLGKSSQYPAKIPVVLIGTLIVAVAQSQVLGTWIGSATAPLSIPLVWVLATRKIFSIFEQRRTGRLYVQFPDALAMIVRSVRVGIPVSESVRNVSKEALEPTATEFALLSNQLSIGMALEDALRDVAARNKLPEYRFFATALSLQAQTGGGLAETLENLSEVIRKRVAVKNRAHALASEARTSTYVLGALPFVVTLAVGALNPKYIGLLFTTSTGNMVLGAAIGMLAVGMYAMRTIITRSLQ